MVVGPADYVEIPGGDRAPLFLLRFDDYGRLLSPATADILRKHIQTRTSGLEVSDVFLFSHGWNNTFDVALRRYRSFLTGYAKQRIGYHLNPPQDYRPVLIGVIWPSTSLVLPWEEGPQIAGGEATPDAETEELLRFLAPSLSEEQVGELHELVDGAAALSGSAAARAAEILGAAVVERAESEAGRPPPTTEELLETWRAVDEASGSTIEDDESDPGIAREGGSQVAAQTAGIAALDPRNLLRTATVWKMKARAGAVGSHGVGPILRDVLSLTGGRVHLIGHSFGARVVLSALAFAEPPRPVRSLLLLQAAVNRWCFAPQVIGRGTPGGYAAVPQRVELPILTTLSPHDAPLRKFFHLALRGSHVGEPDIAAIGNTDLYGALGGYGPAGLSSSPVNEAVPAGDTTRTYDLSGPAKVVAINGGTLVPRPDGSTGPAITGHGDVSNPTTWWALHALTSAS